MPTLLVKIINRVGMFLSVRNDMGPHAQVCYAAFTRNRPS